MPNSNLSQLIQTLTQQSLSNSPYEIAANSLHAYYHKHLHNSQFLSDKVNELMDTPAESIEGRANLLQNALLLDNLQQKLHQDDFTYASPSPNESLVLHELSLDIPIAALLTTTSESARKKNGALLIHLSEEALSDKTADLLTILLKLQLQANGIENVNPKFCIVWDVLQDTFHHAPSSHKRLSKQLEAACTELAGGQKKIDD